eukprot:Em0012g610a
MKFAYFLARRVHGNRLTTFHERHTHDIIGIEDTSLLENDANEVKLSQNECNVVEKAPDGFDAVSVQNVGSTYIIVSRDLPAHSNGILINFSLYCNGALVGVLPLTVISYNTTGLLLFTLYMYMYVFSTTANNSVHGLPVTPTLHSSWNVVLGVISAAASLPSTGKLSGAQRRKRKAKAAEEARKSSKLLAAFLKVDKEAEHDDLGSKSANEESEANRMESEVTSDNINDSDETSDEIHCDSNLLSMRTALLGAPPDPESDTDDIVISLFINKIINPDKSFGSSSDPMCILLPQLSSLLVEHTAPNIHDSKCLGA